MIKIKQASSQQLPVIQQIAYETWPVTFGPILSPEQIAYMLEWMYSLTSLEQQMIEKNHQFLLVQEEDENRYLGFVSYELDYLQEQKTKIHKIYLLPSAQGKGLGKLLFDEVEKAATQHGDTILSLNVNRNNQAIKFYERIGFSIVKTENIPIGNGFLMEDYVMEKPLTH